MTARLLLCLMTLWLVGATTIPSRPPAHGVQETVTIAELQPANLRKDRCFVVTDAAGDSDCSSGGGASLNICCSNGTAYFAVGDGAGAGSFDLNVSGDAGPAQVITDVEVLVVSGGQSINTLMIDPDEVSIRVTANSIRADELASTITFSSGDIIILPINAVNQTTDGQFDYDTTSERLKVGDDGVGTHEFLPLSQWNTESALEGLLGVNLIVETEIDTSSELLAIVTDATGTGLLVFGTTPTLTTPVISGAISFPDNVRQTFNPGSTVAGLNVGALAGDPSTPINGDVWYDSTAEQMRFRENGISVSLGGNAFGVIGNATADSSGDTLTVTDGIGIDFTTTNDPEDLTAEWRYDNTLAGNPALLVDQCVAIATLTGGGFICEGSVANDNEQAYLFPDSDGADVTERIVTTVGVASRGSVIRGSASGPWEELVLGISGTHLFSNGTDVAFFDSDNVDFILLTTAVPGSSGGISIDTNGDNVNIIDATLQFQEGTTDHFIPSPRTYPVNQADVLSINTTSNQYVYKFVTGGDGITVTGADTTISVLVDLNATADGTGDAINLSGLEFTATSELALLQGCVDGDVLKWIEATSQWDCAVDVSGGTINSFETWNPPAGTDPVASSPTDTMLITDGFGIIVTGTAATDTLDWSFDYSLTLAGNPALGVDECVWSSDGTGGVLICEGPVADAFEGVLLWPVADSDKAITIPNVTDTLVARSTTDTLQNKTIDSTNSILTGAYNAASIDGDDIATSIAGDGLILTPDAPDTIDIDLNATLDGVGLTSSLSGMEFTGAVTLELALLQGCADTEVLVWEDTGATWDCGASGGTPPLSDITDPVGDVTFVFTDGEEIQWTMTSTINDPPDGLFHIVFDQPDDADATDDIDVMQITMTLESGDAGDRVRGMKVTLENGTANTILQAAYMVENNETTAGTMLDGIRVISPGVDGGIVDALDVSAANITNALNMGANNILTGTATIAASEMNRLDGLAGVIGTDPVAVTDLDGAGLLIVGAAVDVIGGLGITANADDIAIDTTEVNDTTWGDNTMSTISWTWNASAVSDPVFDFTGDPPMLTFNGVIQLDDGVGDSPSINLIDATNRIWSFQALDATGNLDFRVDSASTETFVIRNTGAGNTDVDIDGTLVLGTPASTAIAGAGAYAANSIDGDDINLVLDLGGHTSFEIPNAAAPVVDTQGEIAVDTTDVPVTDGLAQFLYHDGGEVAVLTGVKHGCFDIQDLVAGDDNFGIWSPPYAVTIRGAYCYCNGDCTVAGTVHFEKNRAGVVTQIGGATPTGDVACSNSSAATETLTDLTSGTLTLQSFDQLRFDTITAPTATNGMNICFTFTVDRQ